MQTRHLDLCFPSPPNFLINKFVENSLSTRQEYGVLVMPGGADANYNLSLNFNVGSLTGILQGVNLMFNLTSTDFNDFTSLPGYYWNITRTQPFNFVRQIGDMVYPNGVVGQAIAVAGGPLASVNVIPGYGAQVDLKTIGSVDYLVHRDDGFVKLQLNALKYSTTNFFLNVQALFNTVGLSANMSCCVYTSWLIGTLKPEYEENVGGV